MEGLSLQTLINQYYEFNSTNIRHLFIIYHILFLVPYKIKRGKKACACPKGVFILMKQ